MEPKQTYHEHTDIENTLRLRQVLATLPPFCRIISVLLTQQPLQKQGFPMPMISAFFFSSFWIPTLLLRIKP